MEEANIKKYQEISRLFQRGGKYQEISRIYLGGGNYQENQGYIMEEANVKKISYDLLIVQYISYEKYQENVIHSSD